jgi:predicted TIM-barrel fold metal-dependent hydrolase
MNDGAIVFDAVVHMHDFRDEMIINDDGRFLRDWSVEGVAFTARNGQTYAPEYFDAPPEVSDATRLLFDESDTDLAMVTTVPLFGLFREGMTPARLAYELASSDPDRYLFCGGVDPLFQGVRGALDEMQRQVEEWGAVSFKFYQAQTMRHFWSADDRELAYPLYEKAQDLGVKLVQFHKGMPLGRQRMETLRPNDLQMAAYDFPDLNFGVHHMGEPYVEETLSIASRFSNIYLILPTLFNQYFVEPLPMLHRLGRALLLVGEDRLCYGTDAFLYPNVQIYIDLVRELVFSESQMNDYGYPALTDDIRRKILGENMAAAVGIDLQARAEKLGLVNREA